jgi:outer membrane putative beta-barrel porin/alpha-amylase
MSVVLRTPTNRICSFAHIVCILTLASVTTAQEMEPRAYSRAPVGSQFVVVSYAYQSGDVLLDSSLPLRDVTVKLSSGSLGYGRTFGLAGRQANVSVLVPYINGRAAGTVFEERQEVRRSGLGDVRLRFSTILKGGPALSPREFASYKPRTHVGVSLTMIAPTGQYDPRRLVNLGSNRWSFKPEVGLSKPIGRWTVELVSGVWLFTENRNFFGGSRREQKPLSSFGGHVIYTLRRRMWASINATYYTGGRTVVNGVVNADMQKNSRIGATFSLPLNQRQSFKVAYAKGLTARFGGDLNTIAFGWQYAWR